MTQAVSITSAEHHPELVRHSDNGGSGDRRALIIDKRAVMGTEMCRSLGRRGFSVDVVGDAQSPAFRSRYCDRAFVFSAETIDETYIHQLDEIVGANRYDAIFICNEQILEALLPLIALDRWRGLVLSAPASLRLALSKNEMLEIARQASVPTPQSAWPKTPQELEENAERFGYPIVVKGDRGESGQHVRLAKNPDELRSAFAEISNLEKVSGSAVCIQERIQGTAYSIGGLFWQGRPLRICAHRKLITVPPWGGLTVRGITERCPELLDEAYKMFAAINFSGLAHIEFIRGRDGRFRFIEVNPRVWGTMGIAETAGVDLFGPYARLARGENAAPDLHFKEGLLFHRIGREVKMLQLQPSRFFGFLKDCLDPRVRSDFEWLDPRPHLSSFTARGFGLRILVPRPAAR